MTLTKEKVREIHNDIVAALTAVATKHGLDMSRQSQIRFDATTFKFTSQFGVKGTVSNAAGKTMLIDPKLINVATRYGLKDYLGREIEWDGLGTVTFVGLSSGTKAIVRADDGKQYKVVASRVKQKLGAPVW
jgi:hypothetical protein